MLKSIYFVTLLALLASVCYTMPKAFDKAMNNQDNMIRIHKAEYTLLDINDK